MKSVRRKPWLRLDAEAHEELRQEVLRRDAWRRQLCGSMTNLEVHHQDFAVTSVKQAATKDLPL